MTIDPQWTNLTVLIVGLLTFASGVYAAASARKANSESTTITGFTQLVTALQKEVADHQTELDSCNRKIRAQSERIDKLERREQIFIRWARSVLTWYQLIIPLLDGVSVPPFPQPPAGIEDTDPRFT